MLYNYQDMPDYARVWVYQSARELTTEEANQLQIQASEFVSDWTAHQHQLKAAVVVKYNRFLIFLIDEEVALASGCSIDKSVRFAKEAEQKFNTTFFDRMNFAYKLDNQVMSGDKQSFIQMIEEGRIDSDTIVFDNLVSDKKSLEKSWEIPIKQSWHRQLFAHALKA